MTKLKTLKDLEERNYSTREEDKGIINAVFFDLRQEIIKWLIELRNHQFYCVVCQKFDCDCSSSDCFKPTSEDIESWAKHVFNIDEEDLEQTNHSCQQDVKKVANDTNSLCDSSGLGAKPADTHNQTAEDKEIIESVIKLFSLKPNSWNRYTLSKRMFYEVIKTTIELRDIQKPTEHALTLKEQEVYILNQCNKNLSFELTKAKQTEARILGEEIKWLEDTLYKYPNTLSKDNSPLGDRIRKRIEELTSKIKEKKV